MSLKNFLFERIEEKFIITQDLLENKILSQYNFMSRDIAKYSLPKNIRKIFDTIDLLSYKELEENLKGYKIKNKKLNELRDMLVNKLIYETMVVNGQQIKIDTRNVKDPKAKSAIEKLDKEAPIASTLSTSSKSNVPPKKQTIQTATETAKGDLVIVGGEQGKPGEVTIIDKTDRNKPGAGAALDKFRGK